MVSLFLTKARNHFNVIKRADLRLSLTDIAPDIGQLMTSFKFNLRIDFELFIVISAFQILYVLDCILDGTGVYMVMPECVCMRSLIC